MEAKSPVRCGILVISDRCSRKETVDESGPVLVELLRSSEYLTASAEISHCVPDDVDHIQAILKSWTDVLGLELVITSGGTGFGVRDVTPEVLGRHVIFCPRICHSPLHLRQDRVFLFQNEKLDNFKLII